MFDDELLLVGMGIGVSLLTRKKSGKENQNAAGSSVSATLSSPTVSKSPVKIRAHNESRKGAHTVPGRKFFLIFSSSEI